MPSIRPLALVMAMLALTDGLSAQCDSSDFALLCNDGDMVNDAVFSCGFSCFLASDITVCFDGCIANAVPQMSAGCVSCFAAQSTCVSDNCFLTCAFGSEADCAACVAGNCQADFENCAGIVDLDGDGESTVCDCDDSNADVYPGAPGTAAGLDNNCDGALSAEELGCPLDLNGDALITVSDVLVLLSEFGCLSECSADIDGDGLVTVSDILALLGGFGTDC
ncbi:MAG: hypothetical protein CBC74_006810 [Crocinitomicaceae bacterium TMED114]|nr:MAG: hypothetical protein CBC74_006810 [Crocinitomicaceae bacterium TMED114]